MASSFLPPPRQQSERCVGVRVARRPCGLVVSGRCVCIAQPRKPAVDHSPLHGVSRRVA